MQAGGRQKLGPVGWRMRLWLIVALLGAAMAGCGGSSQHSAARALSGPHCSTAVASGARLRAVGTSMIALPGPPFGIATTRDGRWSFVDEITGAGSRVAVFSDREPTPRLVHTTWLPSGALGNALTDDGRYLVVADGNRGATVVSVARAEAGAPDAVLGTLGHRPSSGEAAGRPGLDGGAIEATTSLDGGYAFVSVEYGDALDVYNLRAAIVGHFRPASYVGSVPLGQAVVGSAVSPNGRWLYVTSELAAGTRSPSSQGTLSVISIAKAERDPAKSVLATVAAGCQPVRVVVSGDGRTVWVTARASDDLLAFSAAKLLDSPAKALLAAVRVGEAPVGLALISGGRDVAVADSNRFNARGARSALTVVDVAAALAHRPAIAGTIPAGLFPREMSAEPGGRTLLVSNFASNQLEAVNLTSLH